MVPTSTNPHGGVWERLALVFGLLFICATEDTSVWVQAALLGAAVLCGVRALARGGFR